MKNKKFMKALGVGAVAALGLFTFTGCSLSDSEKAKLMNGLDNATEYMEETIEQLKEQNKKLKEQNQTAKSELEESKKSNAVLEEYLAELKKQVKLLEDSLLENQTTNTTLSAQLQELKNQIAVLEDALEVEQSENDILQDYLEEIQNENAKITAEEALKMLVLAENNFITNFNGIRDNMKIIGIEDNDGYYAEHTMEYYQSENNGYVYIATENSDDKSVCLVAYEEDGKVFGYEKNLNVENEYKKRKLESYSSSEAYADIGDFADNIMFEGRTSADDIKSVEILDNGNYKITVVLKEEGRVSQEDTTDMYYTLVYEITKDCRFVKTVAHSLMQRRITEQDSDIEYEIYKGTTTITFEYNTLTEDYINDLLQEAISKEITSNN